MMATQETARASDEWGQYEHPRLDEFGSIVELTNGTANDNIKDANAWYY